MTRDVDPQLSAQLADLAREGRTDELVAHLDAGVSVDHSGADSGDTLLMLASYHRRTETVIMLLQRGADPNLANLKGQTPLAGAVFKDAVDVLEALVRAGADPHAGEPSAWATAQMLDRVDLIYRLDPPRF